MRDDRWLWGHVLAVCLCACVGDELTLGRAAPVIDLHRCQATDCAPELPSPRELPFPDPATCQPSETGEFETAFFVEMWPRADDCGPFNPNADRSACQAAELMHLDCPVLGPCRLRDLASTALSPDGSIWTIAAFGGVGDLPGTADTRAGGVWLQRFAQDGSRLSSEALAAESAGGGKAVIFSADMQLDQRGHAFVLITRQLGSDRHGDLDWTAPSTASRYVLELDEQGQRVGASIALVDEAILPAQGPDMLTMLWAGERMFFVARAFGGGGVGMFDLASRETRWVQSRAGRLGIANAIVDTAHELTITTRTPNSSLSRRVEHYRADGTLAWERRWPMSSPDLAGEPYDATLSVDSQGTLSMLLVDWNEHGRLFRMSRDGEQLFAREYDAYQEQAPYSTSSQLTTVTSMSSGAIVYSPVVVTDEALGEPTSTHTIVVVSSDGERCTRHVLRRPGYATFIRLMAQDDRLYFSTGGGFGGLKPPHDFLP